MIMRMHRSNVWCCGGQVLLIPHRPAAVRMVNELRAKGVKTICIDPRFTPDAAKADIWLPIRPGTDVALQMAWIRYILENRRYDEEFVTRWTNLPYLVEVESRFFARAKKGENGAPDTFYVWDEKTASMQPMEYPYDEKLSPALWGTYEVDGKSIQDRYAVAV